MAFDSDLIAYYRAEAAGGRREAPGEFRVAVRQQFVELLHHERRRRLVEVGAGPGLEMVDWQAAGFDVAGLDLVHANVELMHQRGLNGVTGSMYHLPFRTGAFEALWTMSTFVHVPHERFDEAMAELVRVVAPGAPLGIGTWGGFDFEGVPEFGDLRPYRFFSLASHDRWRQMLERHGSVELFETHRPVADHGWEYQFAVLRAPR